MVRQGSAKPSPPVQIWVPPPIKIRNSLDCSSLAAIRRKCLSVTAAVYLQDRSALECFSKVFRGQLAQLVAHHFDIVGVTGSNPVLSIFYCQNSDKTPLSDAAVVRGPHPTGGIRLSRQRGLEVKAISL